MRKIKRNNTNFPQTLLQIYREIKWPIEYSFLKYYQNIVRYYSNEIVSGNIEGQRGLLISLQMGMGKSITAVSIAIDYVFNSVAPLQVIMIMGKSLRSNMISAIKKYISLRSLQDPAFILRNMESSEVDKWIDKWFSFVNMNASNMIIQLGRATTGEENTSLKNRMVIVDEAHNLFRAITNGSKNGKMFYDLVKEDKPLIFFLTGTAINNHPFELVPAFNMCAGEVILPENYSDFAKLFILRDGKKLSTNNINKFKNRIMGLSSWVGKDSKPGSAIGLTEKINVHFPTLREHILKIPMSENQFTLYQLARDLEIDENSNDNNKYNPFRELPQMQKPKSASSSTYRVKSRQISNFAATKPLEEYENADCVSEKFKKVIELAEIYRDLSDSRCGPGILYSQFVGSGGLGSLAKYLIYCGWTQLNNEGVGNVSKIKKNEFVAEVGEVGDENEFIEKVSDENEFIEKVESGDNEFIEKVGSGDSEVDDYDIVNTQDRIAELVNELNYEEIDIIGGANEINKTFAIISGEVSTEDREKLVNKYNSVENIDGNLISLLLVSSTGAEGLDLKHTRYEIALEPYWNWARMAQFAARGARNDSHVNLPAEKQFVDFYILVSTPPSFNKTPTTDEELLRESLIDKKLIDEFQDAITSTSIECLLNNCENCRVCSTTNLPLWSKDIRRDINGVDPCELVVEQNIKVTSIKINDIEYFYEKTNKGFGYKIYLMDNIIGNYRLLSLSHHSYQNVLQEIINSNNENIVLPNMD